MIKISNLTKIFKGNIVAVNNLSIEIGSGVYGLVGENGAGKSTLLRCIADVYEKTSGEILIDGLDSSTAEGRKKIFFLSDNPFCNKNDNAFETMRFYESLFDLDVEIFKCLINKLSLPLNRKVSTYSKGMKRQLFLCIALSIKAQYILLDEAFDGLDPIVQTVVKEEICESSKDKTYIISSHNIPSLEKLCDNFILLSKGTLTKTGSPQDIGKNYCKFQVFFKESVTKEQIDELGINVVHYSKSGSITHLILEDENLIEVIKKSFETILCEKVAITNDEIIKLELLLKNKGGNK